MVALIDLKPFFYLLFSLFFFLFFFLFNPTSFPRPRLVLPSSSPCPRLVLVSYSSHYPTHPPLLSLFHLHSILAPSTRLPLVILVSFPRLLILLPTSSHPPSITSPSRNGMNDME